MSDAARRNEEKVVTSLMLAVLIVTAIALMREGPQYDNVLESTRFFTLALFSGAVIGFIGWMQTFRVAPKLSLAPPHRQPWIAALTLGLVFAIACSWFNRTFSTPTNRSFTAEIDSLTTTRHERWHLTVKLSDGTYARYLITPDAAARLKGATAARIGIARGALGFDYVATFEPPARF